MRTRFALARQLGQRWGTFCSPFSAKKRCSPPEKMKSSAQSRQVRVRSSYTVSVLRSLEGRTSRSAPRRDPSSSSTDLDPEPAGENTVAVKRRADGFDRGRAWRCPTAPPKGGLDRPGTERDAPSSAAP